MGKIGIGKHVIISAPSAPLELDGIPFRSEAFVDGEYLRYLSGQIITGPGGGGSSGSFPTRPFRVTSDGVVEYDSIQAAIDAASADDVIYVPAPPSGTSGYNEQIVVNKQVNLVAIGGKRCRITHPDGPVVTVTSRCRITGFWIEAGSGTAIRFDEGSEYAIIDDVETNSVEINISDGWVYFNFVRCYTLTINSSATTNVLDARFCFILELIGGDSPSTVTLFNSYLGTFSGAITIHHSGGSPADFLPSEQYRNYNIPWATEVDSYLVYRPSLGCWLPEPLPELGGGGYPLRPFRVVNGEIIEYDTIQEAVNAGGVVYIPPGQYNEAIAITNDVTIIGLVPGGTFISSDSDPVFSISNGTVYLTNVRISGLASNQVLLTGTADVRLTNVNCGRLRMQDESFLECWFSNIFLVQSHEQSGLRVRANLSKILNLGLDGAEAELNSTYLGGMAGYGVIRHSGGSPGNFIYEGITCDYYNLNIPYQPLAPSVLVWTEDRWRPLPLDELPGGGSGEPHHTTHEDGGTDEINVNGLSGRLADYQKADQIGPWPVDISTPPQDGFVLGWSASQGKIVWLDPPQLSVSLPLSLSPMEASTQTESSTVSINLTLSNVPG